MQSLRLQANKIEQGDRIAYKFKGPSDAYTKRYTGTVLAISETDGRVAARVVGPGGTVDLVWDRFDLVELVEGDLDSDMLAVAGPAVGKKVSGRSVD
jgi:hypothetical protein